MSLTGKAKEYIDADDVSKLKSLDDLDLLLRQGITVNVRHDFGHKYIDMTLIQYAIAKRKIKTMKYMLDTIVDEDQVSFENIIIPDTSNTKGCILFLAIEFGSKSKIYETLDNSCLEVIINNSKNNFSFDIEDFNGKTLLLKAIDYLNFEAIKLFIDNDADLFHKSQKN